MRYTAEQSWAVLHGEPISDDNYWINQSKIPLGTLRPYELYPIDSLGKRIIPKEDIVTIPFDGVDIRTDSRSAYNYLFLGASGDGKSLMIKTIWSVLQNAGFYNCYIDPTKTASGRARMPWDSPRIAPHLPPAGIPIQHFMPSWSIEKVKHMIKGNFRTYSTRLKKINTRYMWMALGMSVPASSFTNKKIYSLGEDLSLNSLKNELFDANTDELSPGSVDNALRILTNIDDYGVLSTDHKELNMLKEWQKGYSVVISYNNGDGILMAFDIAQKIIDGANINDPSLNRSPIPIMYYFDDAKGYAKDLKVGNQTIYNLAVSEITDIGVNYRGRGIHNTLAIQSLNILDETIAETYKIKIISPLFQSVDQLSKINIPRRAIDILKGNQLVIDRKYHLMQWILIDADNNVIPFFPFTPPCHHFVECYHFKDNGS